MSRTWKRLLSLLLVFAMALSFTVTAYAETKNGSGNAGVTFEKVDNSAVTNFRPAHRSELEATPEYADDDVVRVSIVLNDVSTLDKGYSTKGIAENTSAMRYRDSLKAKQDALANKISKEVLGGAKLDVVWNMTLAANMISANVEFGKIEAIKNVIGVKDVVLETRYEPATGETAEPNMSTASEMVGGNLAWAAGYTGAGSKIAILDTGLDTDHELFQADAFQKAIDEVNGDRETPVALMTAEDVAGKWDQLNIAKRLSSVDGVYRDAKVPFGANYVDSDLDITHDNDTQGEHGSHVAGIAAANRYVTDDNGGFVASLDKVVTQGEAPDAQLVIMKVFGKGGGAYDSDYMVGIEDAIILGCDSVNLSLGSSVAGLTYNATYAETLAKFADSDTVVTISAGNNYDWTKYNLGQYGVSLYEDDVNYATGGSPGTYPNAFTVASIDNAGMTGSPAIFNGEQKVFYTETSGYGNEAMASIAGEYEYIYLDAPGTDEEWAALGAELVSGKIAMCNRGSTSFYQKANAAAEQGAAGVIIVNNQAGSISMNLTDYKYKVPAVSITLAEGAAIKDASESAQVDSLTYYTGKVEITNKVDATIVTETPTMSDFSSWGVPSSLTLKPEITAPGGNIYSVNGAIAGGKSYEIMSGTSMAAPQMAGLSAVMGQYVRDNDLVTKTGLTQRQLIQSLLMSTAEPVVNPNTGYYYSVMKQGAGLANVNNAMNARSYVLVTEVPESAPLPAAASIADGKVKMELGEVGNEFQASFSVTNFSEEGMELYLSGEFFTQLIASGFRWQDTDPVADAVITWTLNGEPYAPSDAKYDFNGDGVANGKDAQHLLDYCADNTVELFNEENADLDGDGNIDTHDAYLAFKDLNGVNATLEAGETANFSVNVTLPQLPGTNGNYVEGYLFITEGETEDGALGVTHSIPVFGFQGNWTDATMFDRGSYLEYAYEFGDGLEVYPYMYYGDLEDDALEVESFLVQYAGDSNLYYFGGNPFFTNGDLDEEGNPAGYLPERNAINSGDMISAVQYTQIRNSGASRFFVTDQYGREIQSTEQVGGSYATYYYASQGAWQGMVSKVALNYTPKSLKEGSKIELNYQLAPEYYVNEDGTVRWDDLGAGATMSIPAVIDNTAPDIVDVSRVTEENSDNLVVMAHDNQYIAAVALYTEDGTFVNAFPGYSFLKRGEQFEYPFDLNTLFADKETGEVNVPDHLLVAVFDYASNQSTYKVNFNTEELENPDVQVTLNMNEATIVNKGSIRLVASVTPWGFEDESVTWTSSDESVVVVDENGLVTSVATDDSSATVTATSNFDPTKSDSCVVTVKFIEKELNGIVWDESGEVWFSAFNTKSLPEYTKLNDSNMRKELASATYDADGTLYSASFNSSDMTSTLYTVDPETWEATAVGAESEIGFMDICAAPHSGANMMLGVYGPYVLLIDKSTGQYKGAFNASSVTGGSNLVGIAYEGTYDYSAYGYGWADYFFLVDADGNLYEGAMLNQDELSGYWFKPSKMGNLGYTVDTLYFQSLYWDGVNMFWSRYNAADNKVNIVMVNDLWSDGSIYNLGEFADNVWPVGGLFEMGVTPDGEIFTLSGVEDSAPEYAGDVKNVVVEPIDFGTPATKTGGLNAMPGNLAKPESVSTDVKVNITADEDLVTNGLITVTYDPETITLLNAVANADFEAVINEPGKYVLAHVTMDGVAKGENILELTFSSDSNGIVTIATDEVNEDHEYGRVETVTLGSTVISHKDHDWSEPVWTWDGDDENGYTAATATFTCPVCKEADTVAATIAVETVEPTCVEDGSSVYTATATFEGETYTDTKTVALPALGHDWGEWVVTTEPTYESEGEETRTCARCGETETRTVPMLKHTGWVQDGDDWYFYDENGEKMTGWVQYGTNNAWYYMDENGVMVTGWQEIDGKWYYFNAGGDRKSGWLQYGTNKVWYYFDQDGVMVTGWQEISGKRYYFNDGGDMKTGWLDDGGYRYHFSKDGYMAVKQWRQVDGKWYYFDESGHMLTSQWIGNYYVKEDGSMAVNEWVDGGKYYVGEDGKWVPNP